MVSMEVTLGEVLQIVSFLFTVVSGAVWLNSRITRLETKMEIVWNSWKVKSGTSPKTVLNSK